MQFLENVENRIQNFHVSDNFDDISPIAIFFIQKRCKDKLTCFNYKMSAQEIIKIVS